jgi:hypothetical protein
MHALFPLQQTIVWCNSFEPLRTSGHPGVLITLGGRAGATPTPREAHVPTNYFV